MTDIYKQAGVDIDAANEWVESTVKPLADSTKQSGCIGGIGGFAGVFKPYLKPYKNPVLVSSCDGVGTKAQMMFEMGRNRSIGIDLVAMSVNDVLAQGARPLFFLDYFATERLDTGLATEVMEGIAEGCKIAKCALLGGETAEMPTAGLKYELAGFAVGMCEKEQLLPRDDIEAGDIVFGLQSNGFHANGYSLLRKFLRKYHKDSLYDFDFKSGKSGNKISDELALPTKIYVDSLVPVLGTTNKIKGLAHITGGGLLGNIPRMLPKGKSAHIDLTTWEMPRMLQWLKKTYKWSDKDVLGVFNCGIGMAGVVSYADKEDLFHSLRMKGETVYEIGMVTRDWGYGEQIQLLGKLKTSKGIHKG